MKSTENESIVMESADTSTKPAPLRLSSLQPREDAPPDGSVLESLGESVRELSAIPMPAATQEEAPQPTRDEQHDKVLKQAARIHKRPLLGFD